MSNEEAIEEFNFFNEGDYITREMSKAKDIVLKKLQETESDLYEANNRINDLLDLVKQKEEQIEYIENEYGRTIEDKDKIIDLMIEHIYTGCDFDNNIKTKDQIRNYFEERCK